MTLTYIWRSNRVKYGLIDFFHIFGILNWYWFILNNLFILIPFRVTQIGSGTQPFMV